MASRTKDQEIFERVGELTRTLKDSRATADAVARKAIRATEAAIEEALEGESLRGMPDLGRRLFGLRVGEASAFSRLPVGKTVMFLDVRGRLCWGRAHDRWAPTCRFVDDHELVASVLEPFVHAAARAIELHLRSAERRKEGFERVARIAEKISAALE